MPFFAGLLPLSTDLIPHLPRQQTVHLEMYSAAAEESEKLQAVVLFEAPELPEGLSDMNIEWKQSDIPIDWRAEFDDQLSKLTYFGTSTRPAAPEVIEKMHAFVFDEEKLAEMSEVMLTLSSEVVRTKLHRFLKADDLTAPSRYVLTIVSDLRTSEQKPMVDFITYVIRNSLVLRAMSGEVFVDYCDFSYLAPDADGVWEIVEEPQFRAERHNAGNLNMHFEKQLSGWTAVVS